MSGASSLLDRARGLRELIESEADLIEEQNTMTAVVVDALSDAGLFRLLVPRDLGGFEADAATIIDVCDELSFADGSVGWAYAQNTSVSGYSAYLSREFAEPLAHSKAAAGMFAPLGVLNTEGDGYRVSGSFKFGSGCGHAEFMGGAGMVMIDGEMAPFVDGLPQMRAFIVPSDQVIFKGNWDVMGLRGTGSFDFEIPEQYVDAGQTFSVFGSEIITGGPIFGLGSIVLATISSVAWATGVARRALHEVAELAKAGRTRLGSLPLAEQPTFQRDFGIHKMAIESARLLSKDSYTRAVDAIADGLDKDEIETRIRDTKAAASYVTKVSKQAVVFAWESSGSVGMRNPSVLQRCMRDIYMGAGHQVFDERNYNESAKPDLGLEPAIF
jgi:alkylation response protein AidB-like acyl-CoA dehydrogenase